MATYDKETLNNTIQFLLISGFILVILGLVFYGFRTILLFSMGFSMLIYGYWLRKNKETILSPKHNVNLKIPRPKAVHNAMLLLYSVILIGIGDSILNMSSLSQIASPEFIILNLIFSFAIMFFLIYMVGKGKNWARFTLLVFFIIGVPAYIYSLIYSPIQLPPASVIISIISLVLQISALILLFQKTSSNWFEAMKGKK